MVKNHSFKERRFDKKLYFEIIKNIKDSNSKFFFDVLGRTVGSKSLFKSELFFENYYSKNTYIECNAYLRDEYSYKKLETVKCIKKVILRLKKNLIVNSTLAVCYLYDYLDE